MRKILGREKIKLVLGKLNFEEYIKLVIFRKETDNGVLSLEKSLSKIYRFGSDY